MTAVFIDANESLAAIFERLTTPGDQLGINRNPDITPNDVPGILDGADTIIIDHTELPTDIARQCIGLKHVVFLGTGARSYMNPDELAALGIEVRIDKPSEAGADRLVNAIGAHVAYPAELIVIDSGTATTFDVIAADGGFDGGVIAPGINLSMEALHNAAAKLPRVAIQKPQRVVGTDTVGAMQSGVFWGYIGLIEGLVARIKAERETPLTVVATGGVASLFHGATASIDHFDPDLTIRGMLEIWRRNSKAR